ncbi:MAG: tryptophan 7-halogenase, partial [Myxococcaceae bacterium]|nr:tryptophan 7-halogenase [Myxococcaceae bacterium]
MQIEREVVIIGAGPAGSVAGAMLAARKHDVLCLEAGTFPRFVIGESLLPRCNDILEEAGLLEVVAARGFMPKPAAMFLKGAMRERFCFAEMFPGQRPAALQVPRADFDQALATAARAKGVDVRYQQRVEAIEVGAERAGAVLQVRDVESGEGYQVKTRFVLDCSGYGRVLPKLLGLEKQPSLSPKVAVFTHYEGDVRPAADREGDIWICIHPRGAWIWIIPFSNGRTSVGVVAERALIDGAGKTDRERLERLLAEDPNASKRLANVSPAMKTTRLESWSASVTSFYGPSWALTGNASEFLDPVFSSGVTLALESAHRAAKCVSRELEGEAPGWSDYAQQMEKAVGVFRVFVESWYDGRLQRLLLHPGKSEQIKRAITAVLGGYVLDDRNPFVRDAEGTLGAALK